MTAAHRIAPPGQEGCPKGGVVVQSQDTNLFGT
jgi:hypothetical protein